jgi:hypothetical protein
MSHRAAIYIRRLFFSRSTVDRTAMSMSRARVNDLGAQTRAKNLDVNYFLAILTIY